SAFVRSQILAEDFREEDRLRIAEAMKIFNAQQNVIWRDWTFEPFTILLVTNENEYLINKDGNDEYKFLGYDSILQNNIYARQRVLNNNFLATFPAISGIPTIVVGLPENTGRSGLDWIVTILHEHFHQYQYIQPGYYTGVDSLDLAGDDKSGMWMLNYDFPYKDKKIAEQYWLLTQAAKNTFLAKNDRELKAFFGLYANERKKFRKMLSEKDYKYFSFQIWQEGIARYTELKIAEWMKNNYELTEKMKELSGYTSVDTFYNKVINKLLTRADAQTLAADGRNCFYTLGALEGMILDRVNPGWKDRYFSDKFFIEKYY
ncbi:MAG: hypothetical protein ABI528_07035, partial [bacterium]